jgi:hypothetical protein
MVDVPLAPSPARVRRLARTFVARYGRTAEIVALAAAATLLQCGQSEYAEIWQQVASTVSAMLSGTS